MKYLNGLSIVTILLFTSLAVYAQNDSGTENLLLESKDAIFEIVEEMPAPPGGSRALYEYFEKKLSYPIAAIERGVEGRVYVNFVIEKDGSITNVKVSQGIGSGCDEEAVRLVKSMPKWNPAKRHGQPVRVRYSIPVVFELNR